MNKLSTAEKREHTQNYAVWNNTELILTPKTE